ncbi:MAG: DJ-1/PfpI family protein [Treponema sp.]|nr:DJ-1/PfpI family protein [Treponema sp.]
MKTALVFLADGFEEIEAVTVIDYLRRAQIEVFTVAVPSKTMQNEKFATGSHNITIQADLTFREFQKKFSENLPDLLYIPGGIPGAPNNASCEDVIQFVKKMFENGKFVTALCASPAVVLSKTGVLKNKKWTCYPQMEKKLSEYCGTKENADLLTENSIHLESPFVTDGNLVTGRGPGATEQFAMELVRLLCGQEIMEKIKKASVQR